MAASPRGAAAAEASVKGQTVLHIHCFIVCGALCSVSFLWHVMVLAFGCTCKAKNHFLVFSKVYIFELTSFVLCHEAFLLPTGSYTLSSGGGANRSGN